MATTANKTKAATTPRIGSTKEVKVAEVAKPTTAVRKGIELVAKVEVPKKAKAVAAKPRKAATKKDSVGAISQPAVVSASRLNTLRIEFWALRGYQHGNSLQDWLRAEQVLQERAS